MSKFAWVINGTIKDVCQGDPASSYTPDVAAHYSAQVPDNARNGDGWDGSTLTPATPPGAAVATTSKVLSRVQFMLLFTPAERVAIRTKVADTNSPDAVLNDWWAILNDPQLEGVDLHGAACAASLSYLVSVNLLTTQRRAAILAS